MGMGSPTLLAISARQELHEKLRWLAFKERRSQHAIMLEALEKALQGVKLPKLGKA